MSSRSRQVAKRLFDVAVSAPGLLLCAPLILLIVILVRRNSPGDGMFRQTRVGRHEIPFTCYKIRTMRTGAPNVGTHLVPRDQTTRVGALLRRTKLDELPQLWNVLKGEMSLVGPRPCLPSQTELIEERRNLGVFATRPGITGLAQVEGIDMSEPHRLARRDRDYVEQQSCGLDLNILVRTFAGGGLGDRSP